MNDQAALFDEPKPARDPIAAKLFRRPRREPFIRNDARDTSAIAGASIAKRVDTDRATIVDALRQRGPLTCDEIEVVAELSHQTASARINGLMQDEIIVDSGQRRATRSGRPAIVWKLP